MLRPTANAIVLAALAMSCGPAAEAGEPDNSQRTAACAEVRLAEVEDLKSVYATVRSKDLLLARVRTPGTIASLKVDEGDEVQPGQVLAIVADPKIALKINALDAQIVAIQSRVDTAKSELERSEALKAKGVLAQARVDQAQTTYDVAANDLKAARAERAVIETQVEEGQVLAPAAGRVLKVPVSEGSVVLAGEGIATIAANAYLLRLELPERHARHMKIGDTIELGARSLAPGDGPSSTGHIIQVYPELQDGRVIADADADAEGLGRYFVGERVLVRISAGRRQAYLVPRQCIVTRFGLDFVRLAEANGSVSDVLVQTGRAAPAEGEMIEILSGLSSGDRLVTP